MENSISVKQVYDELKKMEKEMVTKKEMQSLIDTVGMMGNPETMRQIAESMEDIKHGRVKEVNSVKDLMDDM